MATMQGSPAERIAPTKRQTLGDRPVVPEAVPACNDNWLCGVARKTISKA